MSETRVRLDRVSKRFAARGRSGISVAAVDDVTLTIGRGEIFGIIGQSGAGKSTLLRMINGLEVPTSGRVYLGERELTALAPAQQRIERREIGMIFQHFNLFRSRTVAGNVAYPLKVAGVRQSDRDRRVARLLDFVGLLERAHDYPEKLSGGQKQRLGIARALATDPSLLLADEPTSALDPETTADVLALLRRVNRQFGVTIVLITHEMEVLRSIADRVAVMEAGRVIEVADVYDVFSRPRTQVAARFAGSVLHDRPSPETLARLRKKHPGRLVTIPITDGGLHSDLLRAFDDQGVKAEIVYGGISELQERPIGSLTFALSGDQDAVDRSLARLAGHRIEQIGD